MNHAPEVLADLFPVRTQSVLYAQGRDLNFRVLGGDREFTLKGHIHERSKAEKAVQKQESFSLTFSVHGGSLSLNHVHEDTGQIGMTGIHMWGAIFVISESKLLDRPRPA